MSEFLMPSLGADMESAILMEWLVKEGDAVTKGQVIAEIETSKGVIEIEVFEDGYVEKLLVDEETECKVGTPLAIISSDSKEMKEEVVKVEDERLKVSPLARKRAEELGVDLTKITPKDGVIQLAQVESVTTTQIIP